MDKPNVNIVHVKLNRSRCMSCRAEAYDMPYRKSETIWRIFDAWWPKNNIFLHPIEGYQPAAGHCPKDIVSKYFRQVRLKARRLLKKHMIKEESDMIGDVRIYRSNYISCDRDAPPWCPYRKHHRDWAKKAKRVIAVDKR